MLALETSSSSEILRKACNCVFEQWIDLYYQKLLAGGFSEQRAKELSIIIHSLIEGAVTICLTRNETSLMLNIAKQIPVLLIK